MDRVSNAYRNYRPGTLLMVLLVVLGLAGCVTAAPSQAAPPRQHLIPVTVAMGYFRSVQFAPFFVAQARGYYRQAGLDPHFQFTIEPTALRLLSDGKVDFVNSGGDEVLAAGAQGLHVRYVMTQYSRFPAALFFLKSSRIQHVSDLIGKRVGIPGFYGASYIGLRALLQAAHVPYSRVHVEAINFTQVTSVETHKVDAAMGYAMNEPVELRSQGYKVGEFDVYHWANLAGAGIATSDAMIAHHPAVVRAFIAATLHGLRDTLHNYRQALAISARAVPELRANLALQARILKRALHFWQPAGVPLGAMDPHVWALTARVLYEFHQIPHPVTPTNFYTNQFIGER
jgi:NitT/TauT family transport system substrate-binding protein